MISAVDCASGSDLDRENYVHNSVENVSVRSLSAAGRRGLGGFVPAGTQAARRLIPLAVTSAGMSARAARAICTRIDIQ
jgi:hypothetical protein